MQVLRESVYLDNLQSTATRIHHPGKPNMHSSHPTMLKMTPTSHPLAFKSTPQST